MNKKFLCRLLNRFYDISCSFLSNMEVVLSQSDVSLPRWKTKTFFLQLWNWFYGILCWFLSTSVVVLQYSDLPLLRYTRKRFFHSFKKVLLHLPFIYENFGCCFASIKRSVGNIPTKMFLRPLWNRFYDILVHFRALRLLFWVNGTYSCLEMGKNVSLPKLKRFYGILRSFLSSFAIVLKWSDVLLPRYW